MTIKLSFLDVDGVLVGQKHPYGSKRLIRTLKAARKKGVRIVLTTAKTSFSKDVQEIIKRAQLDNMHITFSGALIADQVNDVTLEQHPLPYKAIQSLLALLRQKHIFREIDTRDRYFIEHLPSKHSDVFHRLASFRPLIFHRKPHIVSRFEETVIHEGLKMVLGAPSEDTKTTVEHIMSEFSESLNLGLSTTPFSEDVLWGIVTAKTASKGRAAIKVADYYKIPLQRALGVGDSLMDWQFMKACGYVATVANAPQDLKKKVRQRGPNHSLIGPSVDEDGVVTIFDELNV